MPLGGGRGGGRIPKQNYLRFPNIISVPLSSKFYDNNNNSAENRRIWSEKTNKIRFSKKCSCIRDAPLFWSPLAVVSVSEPVALSKPLQAAPFIIINRGIHITSTNFDIFLSHVDPHKVYLYN